MGTFPGDVDFTKYKELCMYGYYKITLHSMAVIEGTNFTFYYTYYYIVAGTAVAQWLRCCATNQKVAGSIPDSVNGFFIDIKSFRSHYGPGVHSASNRNEYQEYFLGVKTAGAYG